MERKEEGTPINRHSNAQPLPLFMEGEQQADERAHNPDFALHFLALTHLRGLGMSSIQALIDHYGDLSQVWRDRVSNIHEVLMLARVPGSHELAEKIHTSQPALLTEGRQLRDYLAKRNIQVLAFYDPQFPQRLHEIPDAPRWLFVEGDPYVLTAGTLMAVVGTREASELGTKTAAQVTWLAAQAGFGLVSGLAEGIDTAAHTKALHYHVPQVAVLGTGINITFPKSTASLRRQIVDTGGCVITEYFPNDNYGKSRFVQRNRIQAGLAEAVCPVEGRAQSGTMHTARFAEKYGRFLFSATRGPASEQNEIPDVLAKMGAPVFDVAETSGQIRLREYLDRLPGPRFPRPQRPAPEFLLRSILKAIDTVASYDELTWEEKEFLLDQMRLRLGLDSE